MAILCQPHGRYLLVACGLFAGLVLAASMSWYVLASRNSVIQDAVREMRNDAMMLAEDEDRLLQAVDAMHGSVIEHMRALGVDTPESFGRLMASPQVNESLRDRVGGLPYIEAILVFGRNGDLLNFSRDWPPPSINRSDQEFFHEIAAAGAPEVVVSRPSRGRVSGQWEIYLSRRFDAADGRVLGYVVSTIEINYFERLFSRLPLTGAGSFTLFRRDGLVIARYPHTDSQIGRTLADSMNFNRVVAALDDGVVRQPGGFDGKDRLMVPHMMAHFPLIVSVSDTLASVLRGWTAGIQILIATAVLLELVIAATILLTLRHMRSHDRLQAAETARVRAEADLVLAEERERSAQEIRRRAMQLDTALGNMQQGLAMFDNSDRLLIANRRFNELIGSAEDPVKPGASVHDVMRLAVAHGEFSRDDMTALHEWRTKALVTGQRTSKTFDMTRGRTLVMTHQPMEDGWLATYEDITDRRVADAKMAYMAHHDALTDLPNRLLLRQELEKALAHARRGGALALLTLDLDQFKAVNDTLGHLVGDALLQAVANRLRERIRETDTLARLGGDEFAVVQAPIEKPTEAANFATRLLAMFDEPFEADGHTVLIGTSIGIAFAPQDGADVDALLKSADLAMYRAKADGRGVYRLFHTAMDAEMQNRRRLEFDLRRALRGGEFELYYQPLIDLRAQAVSGFEALLRWHHPEEGMVSPARFIPLAEEIGVIVPIGEWVLRTACLAAASWPGELSVSVNLSPAQFKSQNVVATVTGALRDARLAPGRLELEITESVMLQDTEATLATLHELRRIGVSIAMDDFGTGYSSLSYLRRFPFDRIKIDQSFVRELGKQQDCGAIIRAVIGLSHELGMATTAEGVETREQLQALALAGCSDVQGFLFSRPVPLPDIAPMLRTMPLVAELLPQAALVA